MQHFKCFGKSGNYNHIKTSITKLHTVCTYHEHGSERSISLGRALDWWLPVRASPPVESLC